MDRNRLDPSATVLDNWSQRPFSDAASARCDTRRGIIPFKKATPNAYQEQHTQRDAYDERRDERRDERCAGKDRCAGSQTVPAAENARADSNGSSGFPHSVLARCASAKDTSCFQDDATHTLWVPLGYDVFLSSHARLFARLHDECVTWCSNRQVMHRTHQPFHCFSRADRDTASWRPLAISNRKRNSQLTRLR